MRYWFFNLKSRDLMDVVGGRSIWEDRIDKADFIVLKEIGPAMEHWREALMESEASLIRKAVIDECIKRLGGRYGAAATKDLQSLKDKK